MLEAETQAVSQHDHVENYGPSLFSIKKNQRQYRFKTSSLRKQERKLILLMQRLCCEQGIIETNFHFTLPIIN